MSLDLMQLMCDVKYITRGYVVVEYAHLSVVDVMQEMKISNTYNGLVLSQSHEKCDYSPARTPYTKSIFIFGKSINLNRHALLDTCASYLYILVGHKVMVGLYTSVIVGYLNLPLLPSFGILRRCSLATSHDLPQIFPCK